MSSLFQFTFEFVQILGKITFEFVQISAKNTFEFVQLYLYFSGLCIIINTWKTN